MSWVDDGRDGQVRDVSLHHRAHDRRVKLGLQAGLWVLIWSRRVDQPVPAGGVITELGLRGARLDVRVPFAVASTLELCFALPDVSREIVCGAVVQKLLSSSRIEVGFTLLACPDRDGLERFVTEPRRRGQHPLRQGA